MTMRPLSKSLAAISIALAYAAIPARAEKPAADNPVEPAVIKALTRMGAYLRSLKTFQVEAAITDEDVLTDGQKIQYASNANVLAQTPGRLRADLTSDRDDRLYLFDGKTFTVLAKGPNFYATIPAPPRIGQLVDKLENDYGVDVPLVDLFRWGSENWKPEGIKAATDIGPSTIEGTTCEQYAFRQDDVDWQIWLQLGDNPLPRKIVITTKTDEARPQHTAVYTWNLAPSFNEGAFKFEPPPGAGKVPMAQIKRPTTANK
jgi:hypothetical protein